MSFASSTKSAFGGSATKGLSPASFGFLRELLRNEAAIYLEDGKEYLVETRLAGIATEQGFPSAEMLLAHWRKQGRIPSAIQDQMIDALTTNETLFFRDLHPFEALRTTVIPELLGNCAARRSLSIWSAACSTGQEAYSVAMMLEESFPQLSTWRVEILGTDLSRTVIDRARDGVYQQFEVNRGLPAKMLVRFFKQNAGIWKLDDSIRRKVRFQQMNLIKPWPVLPKFEIIFLRNVLIYFEVEVRREILRKVRSVLAPGGYLILGNAETAVTLDRGFKPVSRGRATFFQLEEPS